jgi:glucose/arabinose dehydrogenase
LHTHLGDGVFINSHAGRSSLLGETEYELRVRFRDDAGSVSAYATREFETTVASAIAPLELTDIDTLPTPYWVNSFNSSIELPNPSPSPPQLRFEAATSELLVRVTGQAAAGNAVDNPFPLDEHVQVRIVIESGSSALNLSPTYFIVYDELGTRHVIHLPAVSLAAGQRLDLWVASNGSTYYGNASQTEPDFSNLARASDVVFAASQPGFIVEEVVGGFQLPVNIAFVPNPGPDPDDPLFYVNELYGTIKVVTRDYTIGTYATGLLNFNPTGAFPGSGEQGLAGIVVDPLTGDLFVTRVASSTPGVEAAPHYPQVVRLSSNDGGLSASSVTITRDMVGETMGQSHQISNITIGPDGKLYVHVGDGFDYTTAQNLNSYRGKVLRMNFDGSAPADNPFYNAADGINAADYVFAYGLRNPFGGAWRTSDGKHYEVENGPSIDRLAQINRGVNYGWNNTNQSMTINAIYNWNPARAPVNIDFIQSTTFAGSQFPASKLDHAFVSESGSTYAPGQQTLGKHIVEFTINSAGVRTAGPTLLVEYTGIGYGTVAALAPGPDGLYFSELYKDLDASSPIDPGARIFRVRYVNNIAGDYNIDGSVNAQDHAQFTKTFGSNLTLAADGNKDGTVDAADYVLWRKLAPAGGSGGVGQAVPDTFTEAIPSPPAADIPSRITVSTSSLATVYVQPQQSFLPSTPRQLAALRPVQAAARDNVLLLALPALHHVREYTAISPTSEDSDEDSSSNAVDDVFANFATLRINLE